MKCAPFADGLFCAEYTTLLSTMLMFCAPICVCAAPTQWPASAGGNNHWYEGVIVPGGVGWEEARALAAASGGYLATIHSQAENDFIFGLISGYSYWHVVGTPIDAYTGPWLGGYQPAGSAEPAGGWAWVTGEPWTYTNWHLNWGGSDLPDNVGNADKLHFVHVWSSITQPTPYWDDLSDIPGGAQYGVAAYIVEYVPEPTCMILLLTGGIAGLASRRWR